MLNEIIVWNKHHGLPPGPANRVIFIGRPSILGNPFSITNLQTRPMVIINYRKWMDWKLNNGDPEVIAELERIAALVMDDSGLPVYIVCFCSPAACHGDVVKEVILEAIASTPFGG